MSNSKQFLKPLNQLNEDSNSIPLLEMPEMSKPFSVLNKPSSINSTWDRYIPLSSDHPALKFIDFKNSNEELANDFTIQSSSDLLDKNSNSKDHNKISNCKNNFLFELPLSFKIDLQKDIVNMLEIMKNEYIKRLGYSNEYTVKAIKAYDDAKKVSDDYEKYF